jgi:DNA-binding transcriptional regulator YiaG
MAEANISHGLVEPEQTYTHPAELVRQARERLHMSQQQLAEVLGLHPRTIARWEEGKFAPHEIWLRRLELMQQEATQHGQC